MGFFSGINRAGDEIRKLVEKIDGYFPLSKYFKTKEGNVVLKEINEFKESAKVTMKKADETIENINKTVKEANDILIAMKKTPAYQLFIHGKVNNEEEKRISFIAPKSNETVSEN